MAIAIFLQTISGNRRIGVVVPQPEQDKLWPVGEPEFPLLQYVDPYGDTVFNGLQMQQVIGELESLSARFSSEKDRKMLAEVIALAENCRQNPHTFLMFVGD